MHDTQHFGATAGCSEVDTARNLTRWTSCRHWSWACSPPFRQRPPAYCLLPHLQTMLFPHLKVKPPSSPHQPLPVGGSSGHSHPAPVLSLGGEVGGRDEVVFSFLSGSLSISWAYWISAGNNWREPAPAPNLAWPVVSMGERSCLCHWLPGWVCECPAWAVDGECELVSESAGLGWHPVGSPWHC